MGKDKVKWGILGCAGIAVKHVIPAIQESAFGEVAAIASRQLETASRIADLFGIGNVYGSYQELLDDRNIDAVYIPLPNVLHFEWTVRAAHAGKHILCEKPLALTADEADKMVSVCRKSGVKLAEAIMYRYHPRYARIQEIVASGEIGSIRGINGCFTYNNETDFGNIRFNRALGGGAIYDIGIYPLSAARMLTKREPRRVKVSAAFSSNHDRVDMMAAGVVEFPDDVLATFQCGMWAAYRNHMEVIGSKGIIEIPMAFKADTSGDFHVTVDGAVRTESFAAFNQYTLQADQFSRSILFDEPLLVPPEDAVRNMKLIEACLKSMVDGQTVEIVSA